MCQKVEFHALVIVVSTGIIRVLLNGLYYSPGILLVAFRDELHATSGVTAWVTSLHYFMFCCSAAIGGVLMKRLSSRIIAVVGGIIMICGLVSSMFTSHIAHVFITFGMITGAGSGLVHIGCFGALNYHMRKHRDLYFGICSFLATVCVAAYAPMLQYLIDTYTWRGMFLILGGLQMNSLAVALLFPNTHIAQTKTLCIEEKIEFQHLDTTYNNIISPNTGQTTNLVHRTKNNDLSLPEQSQIWETEDDNEDVINLKEAETVEQRKPNCFWSVDCCTRFLTDHAFLKLCRFQMYLLSTGLFFCGAGIIWGHLTAYSVMNGISDKMSASVYYTINMATMSVARLLQGVVLNTGKVRPLTIHIVLCGLSGLATFVLLWEVPYGVVCAYVAILGPGASCIGGVVSPAVVLKSTGMENFEFGFGLLDLASGIGYLVGAPVAGWIFDITGSYRIPFALAAVTMTFSSASVMCFLRQFKCAGPVCMSR